MGNHVADRVAFEIEDVIAQTEAVAVVWRWGVLGGSLSSLAGCMWIVGLVSEIILRMVAPDLSLLRRQEHLGWEVWRRSCLSW